MENTKHDLCSDSVTLDYDALLTTSRIAVGRCLNDIEQYTKEIREHFIFRESGCIYLSANYLKQSAQNLTTSLETYYALKEGTHRSKKTFTNIPKETK